MDRTRGMLLLRENVRTRGGPHSWGRVFSLSLSWGEASVCAGSAQTQLGTRAPCCEDRAIVAERHGEATGRVGARRSLAWRSLGCPYHKNVEPTPLVAYTRPAGLRCLDILPDSLIINA